MSKPDIIVIGASAGGVQALQTLVSALPGNLPVTVFVVLHTTAEGGHLADVLGRNGNMKAVKAIDGERVQKSRIYVAPPGYHLTVTDSRLRLDVGPTINRHRPAIDPLFESAAKAYGSRVIGVVLTGYLDDGVAGLAAIKRRGGIAMVQDPADSYARNMPLNALRYVAVDYCLPMSDIGPQLVALVKGKNTKREKQG